MSAPQHSDESTIRFEERGSILRLLRDQALQWSESPSKVRVVRLLMARIGNHEHHAEAAARARKVQEGLRERARVAGDRAARTIFAKRGDHSEAHLNEAQIAGIISAAFELGFEEGYAQGVALGDVREPGRMPDEIHENADQEGVPDP
jgi:hypothetical protein